MRGASLQSVAAAVRSSRGLAHKSDIADVVALLGPAAAPLNGPPILGDDCAALPDGDGYLLFAIEGFVSDFVAADPRFAGYCGIMVNLSDIAAMGGRPLAVVDAVWSSGDPSSALVLDGLREAAQTYGVAIVGGHTNRRATSDQLAVAVVGRAKRLISSFDARDGDTLIAAIDLRGTFRGNSPYWDAATGSPADRLRGDLALLPELAEAGLVTAGKDISMAGLVGTAIMLAESSGRGLCLDIDAIPCPLGVDLSRFVTAFPSFGFILSVRPSAVGGVLEQFTARAIACAAIGNVNASSYVTLMQDEDELVVWDLSRPLIGCGPSGAARADRRSHA
jgi:AIR synthase-related protein